MIQKKKLIIVLILSIEISTSLFFYVLSSFLLAYFFYYLYLRLFFPCDSHGICKIFFVLFLTLRKSVNTKTGH